MRRKRTNFSTVLNPRVSAQMMAVVSRLCHLPYSKYYQGLDIEGKKQYDQKLAMLGSLGDLYSGLKNLPASLEWQHWPSVEYPDIYNYLIATPSLYTKDKLKAYKSLEAYKYFTSGWVSNVTVHHVPPGGKASHLIMARVKHSQKLSVPFLYQWIALEQSCIILCAHCTCMAGLGEVCSHIAAILFLMEANTKIKANTSSTSLPCYWLPPAMQSVPYVPIAEIDFTTPVRKRQKMLANVNTPTDCHEEVALRKPEGSSEPSDEELSKLYKELAEHGKPAILSIIPDHCDAYIPACIMGTIPSPLSSLFKKEYAMLKYTELLDRCNQRFDDIKVSPAQALAVEENTRSQTKSKLWFQQRSGRVTASKLKAAVHTNADNPSRSLIMSICYPESRQFYSKATNWGCKHEETARSAYVAIKEKMHQKFKVRACGLFIHPTYPHLGASPDGIITCACCSGIAVLEVKCPYSCRDKSFLEACNDSNFYLKLQPDGGFALNTTHSYYYQVQAQIKLCKANYCDFVVWNENDLFIQ